MNCTRHAGIFRRLDLEPFARNRSVRRHLHYTGYQMYPITLSEPTNYMKLLLADFIANLPRGFWILGPRNCVSGPQNSFILQIPEARRRLAAQATSAWDTHVRHDTFRTPSAHGQYIARFGRCWQSCNTVVHFVVSARRGASKEGVRMPSGRTDRGWRPVK